MNIIRIGRNVTIVAFLLSLLFHISSILYIFSQKTHHFMHTNMQENELIEQNTLLPQPQQSKNNPWVETRARAGNFGAPVLFQDVPENTSQKDLFEQTLNEETSNVMETTADELAKEVNPDFVETADSEQNTIKSEANSAPIETLQKEGIQDAPIETLMQQPTTIAPQGDKGYPRALEDILQQVQDERGKSKKNIPLNHSQMPTPDVASSFVKTSKNTSAKTEQKPPITLAQLTQGFLHQRKEQSGSYGISMLGIKRGIPSEEQMRYERYLQKLVWCLQNSFNINRYKQPAISSDAPVHVFFSLNRDGILQHLSIKKSSGNMYIDQFVLFIFQDASSSFPPVPSYLTDNPFSMTCVVS